MEVWITSIKLENAISKGNPKSRKVLHVNASDMKILTILEATNVVWMVERDWENAVLHDQKV